MVQDGGSRVKLSHFLRHNFMDFGDRLKAVNASLKVSKVRATIGTRGGALYIQATLPPRPGSSKEKPHQQKIFPGLSANPNGLRIAEKEARKILALLECKEFSWQEYVRFEKEDEKSKTTCEYWVKKFEEDYFSSRKRSSQTETTYRSYAKIFKKLPQEAELTTEVMRSLILSTPPDTRLRQRACTVLKMLSKFSGVPLETSNLSGSYNPREGKPLEIPNDETIASWYDHIKNPAWKWAYGMMATYGLRPHEVFKLDLERFKNPETIVVGELTLREVQVFSDTKTGFRKVWSLPPRWYDRFNLSEIVVPVVGLEQPNEVLGRLVSQYFKRNAKIPFVPYTLRHAFAIRMILNGIDISIRSQQMGHSVDVHAKTYNRWINDQHHREAFARALLK